MQLRFSPVRHVHTHILYVAHEHDEWPMFRIWFSISTIAASIILNLGVFVLLVTLHMTLDIIKYRTKHRLAWHWVGVETLRESLMDIFFIALGLLFALAFHHAVAIGGLGKLAEMEILLLNLILRVGPRIKLAEHFLEIILYWKHHFEKQIIPHAPLSKSEKGLCLATAIIALGIVTTPYTTPVTWQQIGATMRRELTPRLELSITQTIQEVREQTE